MILGVPQEEAEGVISGLRAGQGTELLVQEDLSQTMPMDRSSVLTLFTKAS
jgi:hypothetical protein